jgi:hypothetical protein
MDRLGASANSSGLRLDWPRSVASLGLHVGLSIQYLRGSQMADVVESAKTGHSSSVAFGGILVGLAWNGSRIIPGFDAARA